MRAKPIEDKSDFFSLNRKYGCGLPFSDDVSILSEPLTIGGRVIPNRLACQAMEGCDGTAEGRPGELTFRRYERFAAGGAGLIWVEATAVQRQARANPRQLYLNRDTLDSFRSLVSSIKETALRLHRKEPLVILQLAHSGRYSKPNGVPEPLIVYNNPLFEKDSPVPADRILTDEQLDRVRDDLVETAVLAQKAGFDGADLKGCHRYLLSETLSAYRRGGRYGGSFENRTRLLLDSLRMTMEHCGSSFIITSRLNIYDGFPWPFGFGTREDGGTEPDYTEPKALVKAISDAGVKLLNLTMGNPYVNPHVNRPYTKGDYASGEHPLQGVARMLHGIREVRQSSPELAVVSSGLTYLGAASPQVAAACIREGWFSLAGYGRMTLAYPDFARDILEKGALDPGRCCVTCGQCTQIMRAGGTPGCAVRDREIYLPVYRESCAGGFAGRAK